MLLQIVLWYNLALISPKLQVGVPFTDVVFLDVSTNDVMTTFVAAFLGLAVPHMSPPMNLSGMKW